MTIRRYALYSQSRSATDAVLRAILAAMPLEFADLVLAWQHVYPDLVVPEMRVVTSVAEMTDADTPVLFTETIDVAGDAAYHYEQNGIPYCVVWSPPDAKPDDIIEPAAHETTEAIIDPPCNLYDADGYAIEVGDALQGIVRYRDTTEGRVRVCAWCEPAWFKLGPASIIFDNAGACSAAHEVLPEGYAEQQDATGQLVQIPPAMVLPPHKHARHARRMKRRRALAAAQGIAR